jgi:hypothetical protein
VTPKAVIQKDFLGALSGSNNLWFRANGEDGRMIETISCFKGPLFEKLVLRNVAVVAIGPDRMGT